MTRRALIGSVLIMVACVTALAGPTQATTTRPTVSGYTQYSGRIFSVPLDERPYTTSQVTPVAGFGLVDDTGVRMVSIGGHLYNHPVFQGSYVLANLNSYRLTGTAAYLDIAERNAQRLIDTRVESDGAWFFPYDFTTVVVGDVAEAMHPPWYSGMAQGRALHVFSLLYEVTKDEKWRAAAEATFPSLAMAPSGTAPYGTYVDTSHRLWLEEYPRYPSSDSENVLNGHNAALFGLLAYWQATGDEAAMPLIRGAISTVLRTAMTGFRRVNASSVYSLRHRTPAGTYHQLHQVQLLLLWRYTHNPEFARIAATFRNDDPKPTVSGSMQATPRTSAIYRADAAGHIIGSRRVRFSRTTSAPVDQRLRLVGGPVALRVSAGPYKSWYFPESPGVTWLLGASDAQVYLPSVRVNLEVGTYTAYKLGSNGKIVASKRVRFSRTSSAPASRSAIVYGRGAYYLAAGTFAGYWLPMQTGVHL